MTMTHFEADEVAMIVWSGKKSDKNVQAARYEFSHLISESALLEEIKILKPFYKQIIYDEENLPAHVRKSKLEEMLNYANK